MLVTILYSDRMQGLILKSCNKCLIPKPPAEFFADKGFSSGKTTICKKCKTASIYLWRQKNRAKYNADQRARTALNRRTLRSQTLKRKYGITADEFDVLLAAQNNKCWICKKENSSIKRPFAADHCHKHDHIHNKKKMRGILCYGCNRALHTLEKDGLLQRAFSYLEYFKCE